MVSLLFAKKNISDLDVDIALSMRNFMRSTSRFSVMLWSHGDIVFDTYDFGPNYISTR